MAIVKLSLRFTTIIHGSFKVSVYPKIDHFSKKLFFAFSDRSCHDLSLKKNFMKKDWINYMQSYKRKTFLCINYLQLIAVNGLSWAVAAWPYANCRVSMIAKHLCLCRWRNAKVCVHLKVGRYTASSWFLLHQTREKPISCKVRSLRLLCNWCELCC